MKRVLLFALAALLICLLAISVSAAAPHDKTVVFVAGGGTGDGSSADSPLGSLTKAMDVLDLSEDCTIVICGTFTQSVNWVYYDKTMFDGSVTYTSVYDGVDYRETNGATYQFTQVRFYCYGDTRFENITFESIKSNLLVIAQHNPVTVGDGVVMKGALKGGNLDNSFAILGGWQKGDGIPETGNDDVNITVLSGSKIYIIPYSRSIVGEYRGTANIKVGGNASVHLHGSAVGANDMVLGKVNVEITDDAHITVVYGATNPVTVAGYEFTWKSGTIEDFQWNCKYTPAADLKVTGERVLNATPTAMKESNYNTIAALFDKVNFIEDEVKAEDPNALKNAEVVYLKDGGTGNGASADNALASMADAIAALNPEKGGTVVLCGPYTQNANFDYGEDLGGKITFTSVYGGVDYRASAGACWQFTQARYVCCSETVFENIHFNCLGTNLLVIGRYFPVTVGEGLKMSGEKMTGGNIGTAFAILGGHQLGARGDEAVDNRDVSITVLSGSSIYIVPFSRQIIGDYSGGTANIYIGGEANVSVLHGSAALPDNIAVGSVKVTIDGNAKIGVVYGCTQITTARAYEFIWKSGSIGDFQWNCKHTPAANLTVTGAKVLRASDAAKAQANFAAIAANFDTVTEVGATETGVADAPVNLTEYGSARGLFLLGLAQGYDTTGTNFGLTDKMTRVQTVVQVIRFLGVENEVKAGNYTHPFSDVPAWANNYVGYAYANNITKGVSTTKFGTDDVTTEAQFITFMLRAIGYSDAQGDFTWSEPYAFSYKVGMTPTDKKGIVFDRGDAFRFAWNTLFAAAKNGSLVKDNLTAKGVISADKLTAATEEAKTAVEVKKSTKLVAENGYYVLPIETYKDKTMAGLMAQFTGFLSGYEFARNSDGTFRLAMPDDWFELCNGPYAEPNSRNPHEDKLRIDEETGLWTVWNDDDFSIDIVNQYILRDMYAEYGKFASKKITDGWSGYEVYDMGGGHYRQGARGLMDAYKYLPQFSGNREFGNLYNVNGEPYIANETLGMSAAGLPNLAVKQTEIFGTATSDRDPILWLRYFTALISMAYIEDDIPTMMREAQKLMPEGCWQDTVVDKMFELYEQYPDNWRQAVLRVQELSYQPHYDKLDLQGETSLNCSFILLGLLYGEGDFYETCKIIGLAGHGGDSTTPTGLTVAAIVCGWSGVDAESKRIINEKLWQDGKGYVYNRALPEMSIGYWMHMEGLPKRLYMADLLDMYRVNFESNLLASGGKIENGNYYIPVTTLQGTDALFIEEFEHGSLDGYVTAGNVSVNKTLPYYGYHDAKLGGAATETKLEKTVSGLTVGEDYRLSAFISTSPDLTATFYLANGGEREYLTVHSQTPYVKREIVFTAATETVTFGISIPAGTAENKCALIDEIWLMHVKEESAGSVSIQNASERHVYTDKIEFAVAANTKEEVLLKLSFANANPEYVNTMLTINGEEYAGVPLYKTGADGRGCAYIPFIAKDASSYTVSMNFDGSTLTVFSAELVTLTDKW